MKIYITGSTGFIGEKLTQELIKKKYNLTALSRKIKKKKSKTNKFRYILKKE